MQHIHLLEEVIAELFDDVYPLDHGKRRAMKPLVAPSLGSLVPDSQQRRLQDNRNYYRLDFADFLDYSTSELPTAPRLCDFADGEARFYQALNTAPREALVTFPAFEQGVAILDVSLTRYRVFVSATMRFFVFGADEDNTVLTTMTFAPMPREPGDATFDPELSKLEEWDRYTMRPPVTDDPQWRFTMSGLYTDYLLEEMEKDLPAPGSLSSHQIATVRESRTSNQTTYSGLFELTRLAVQLPAYFDFMYDLVVEETVSSQRPEGRVATSRRRSTKKPLVQPKYRIVKSIHVIRERTSPDIPPRTWTPPQYSFAVKGHWRTYADPSVTGHDPFGNSVLGKTWVRSYTKGTDKPPRPEDTGSLEADPDVVISIKQTLAHARDVINAHSESGTRRSETPSLQGEIPRAASRPSTEWMATERSKLTAGLRFLILKRDEFRCRLCGKSAAHDPGVRLEVDHITPVALWGTTTEENLWSICRECNRGKAAHPLDSDG